MRTLINLLRELAYIPDETDDDDQSHRYSRLNFPSDVGTPIIMQPRFGFPSYQPKIGGIPLKPSERPSAETPSKPTGKPSAETPSKPTGKPSAETPSTTKLEPSSSTPYFPVSGSVTSLYGDPRHPYTGHSGFVSGHVHAGVDLSAPKGSPVSATEGGTVLPSSGWHRGYGNTIDVLLPDGRFVRYAHLDNPLVSVGDTVKAGQSIGSIGQEGHVHFEVHSHYDPKNPVNNYGRNTTIDPSEYFGGIKRGQNIASSDINKTQSPIQSSQSTIQASSDQWKPEDYPNAPIESRQPISHPERNNPGNLRFSATNDWIGKTTPAGSAFEHFDTIDNGVRARALTYKTYLNRGVNTIDQIAKTSGPASDNNDIPSQIETYKRALGGDYAKPGGEHLPINLTPENIRRLTAGGISIEAGGGGKFLPQNVGMPVIDRVIGNLYSQGAFNSPNQMQAKTQNTDIKPLASNIPQNTQNDLKLAQNIPSQSNIKLPSTSSSISSTPKSIPTPPTTPSMPTPPTPVSSTPVSSTPVSSTPASSTPASSTPASSTPASSTPASSTLASSTPASSTPASSTPASSTPASSTSMPSSIELPANINQNQSKLSLSSSFIDNRRALIDLLRPSIFYN
jgi:murein DD-endopeptidase MepM/ murein hydrolase activator NlpD